MRYVSPINLLAVVALSGCLDRGEYPSLRPRAFEIAGGVAPLPEPSPAGPARADIVARVAALVNQAEAGQTAFVRELAAVRPAVARAGPADSESWIAAQQALSALGVSRAPTMIASAELDALTLRGVDAAGLTFGTNDFAAVRVGSERVGALLERQRVQLAELASSLAVP